MAEPILPDGEYDMGDHVIVIKGGKVSIPADRMTGQHLLRLLEGTIDRRERADNIVDRTRFNDNLRHIKEEIESR